VVWETGLGGRLDCTNIVEPTVSVITAIGMDHTRILGTTVAEIAGEKAGIVKPGRPVIVQRQPWPEAFDVIAARAVEVGAELIRADSLFKVESGRDTLAGRVVTIGTPEGPRDLTIPLRGAHQDRNLETALAACWVFETRMGRTPSVAKFLEGAAHASWPGRLELVTSRTPGRALLLDGAHCPLSARALGATLREWESSSDAPARGPWTLLLGMQADKDIAGFVAALTKAAAPAAIQSVASYEVPGGRGATAAAVASAARSFGMTATDHASPEAALDDAMKHEGRVLAAGTLYTLSRFREHWNGVWG
jgi:dihydrofolate synthase/folylpolyglutamate synthase